MAKLTEIAGNGSSLSICSTPSETRVAFQQSGLLALDFDSSPLFFRFGELTAAVVAVTTIRAADGRVQEILSVELAQKLRLGDLASKTTRIGISPTRVIPVLG